MSDGRWEQIEIHGKPAEIYEPPKPTDPPQGLLYLHDYDLASLKDIPGFSDELDRHGFHAIAPAGGHCWWSDVVCGEFDASMTPLTYLREHVVPEFARRWSLKPPAIAAMGVGMGGQGALQLAYRHPREFPVVAAISPAVDFQRWHGRGLELDEMFSNAEAARQATVILVFHPLSWPRHQLIVCDPADPEWFEGTERLVSKLSSMGVPFERDLTTSQGDRDRYLATMAGPVFQFISERLEQVGRSS